MHIITRKRLNELAEKYPDTRSALAYWYSNHLQVVEFFNTPF